MNIEFDSHDWVILVIVVLLLVLGVWAVIKHGRDLQDAQRIRDLQMQVTRDSLARETAVAKTDSIVYQSDTLTRRALRVGTLFRDRSRVFHDSIARLLSTLPETVTVKEVLRQVDTIRVQAQQALQACTDALSACDLLKVQVMQERQQWRVERQDLQSAATTAKKLSRHWGLGTACGGAVVYQSGLIKAGPGCVVGFVYRW